MKNYIEIWTDGGCFPNPGTGRWAFALKDKEYQQGEVENTTNNIMELTAIIKAIEYGKLEFEGMPLVVYSDSQYSVNGFSSWMFTWQKKKWTKKGGLKNAEFWKHLWELKDNVSLEWVRGHNGDPMNEFVDSLVSFADEPSYKKPQTINNLEELKNTFESIFINRKTGLIEAPIEDVFNWITINFNPK